MGIGSFKSAPSDQIVKEVVNRVTESISTYKERHLVDTMQIV
ncbi:MAG: hypothetical protein ACD_19C00429G0054 [uncultured bacterium]|nr:MAG: hypothetical protein ACD_19C00429G0054 [uncultured bacterium]